MQLLKQFLCSSFYFLATTASQQTNICSSLQNGYFYSQRSSSNFVNTNNKMTDATTKIADETYDAGSSSVAFVTTPDENSAKKIARGLLEKQLAACVNIMPQIQSIYMWEGKINEDNEYLLMIKTRTSRVEELTKWVRDNHPYSVAEVIALPIQKGNAPYLNWIAQTVPDKK